MKKISRRGWNNVLIFAVIAFMLILNLPMIIKENFMQPEQTTYPYVLNPEADIKEMHFSQLSIQREATDWVANKELTISALELVQRWHALAGTQIDSDTFSQLKDQLPKANTLEVWYLNTEEPQRVTYYQTPNFWLMKGWQQHWIAVSVDENYLFPISN
ncbi:hypothetical protein R3X26_07195 [Vibrio sp. TH_r3]|uniref:hypothetical protein n=1 Tax=Vibrio sp. TH_r3 TaxID=3082084 RepID=UPI002954A0E9|nr:hypothetical protein [Vibrio sp. TH_r3]MDV7104190.1 hypothetical protein [Vibrio sp. TH_r3]